MDAKQLTDEQLARLLHKVTGLHRFLNAVIDRMNELAFEHSDQLYLRVRDAQQSARLLRDELTAMASARRNAWQHVSRD